MEGEFKSCGENIDQTSLTSVFGLSNLFFSPFGPLESNGLCIIA